MDYLFFLHTCWWKYCLFDWSRSWISRRNSVCVYVNENNGSL